MILAAPARGEDWPQWRGPRGDGTWKAPALPATWPDSGLKRVWTQPIGGGYAGIAVHAGRVYTMDRERLADDRKPADNASDGHERVLCFAAGDGKILWTHAYPTRYGGLGGYNNGPRAMPTVHDGRVYTLGAVGHLHCLDAVSGTVLWSKDMVKDCKARIPEWGFAASPVIDNDLVIVHTGAEPDGSLIAFDHRDGKEVWRSLSDPTGYCTPIVVETGAGRLLITWTPENVHGLDPRSGKVLWSVPYKVTYGVAIATPIFHQQIVFVTGYWEGAKAIRLGPRREQAELIWEDRKQLRGIMAQPLYRDGHAYSLDRNLGLVCFELKTGRKLWEDHRLTPKARNPHASMVWIGEGDRALIFNSDGDLILARLDPRGYHEQARTRILNGGIWSHPAFADKFIFARNDGGERSGTGGPYELICVRLVD